MAPQYDESLPLITEDSRPGKSKIRRVSSIQEELGPTAQKGTASVFNVGVNMAKTAAGTGILALPYACKQGGLVLFILGMFLISIWNVYCMKQLCESLEYLIRLADSPDDLIRSPTVNQKRSNRVLPWNKCDQFSIKFRDPPPEGTSAFSKLGWYALGEFGLWSIDLMMLMLLLFINIAFEVAILTFIQDTPFTTGEKLLDGTILALVLVPFCIVDDMSGLSKLSRFGLIILGITMVVVAFYGIIGRDDIQWINETVEGQSESSLDESASPFTLLPRNGMQGVSKWFGCVVFSFGVVPLTFNFRESMAEPEKLPQTAMISMSFVGVFYTIIGVCFLYLFPNIENDLLAEIPSTGIVATTTRFAMIIVVMASTPLLIVPCAEIIEGKILKRENGAGRRSRKWMIIIRTLLLLGTVSVAAELPNFVSVLAFVGCFAVSMVSFVLPPGLHWLLLGQGFDKSQGGMDYPLWSRICDISMLFIGFGTTIITTWFTGS